MQLLVHRKLSWMSPVSSCGMLDIDGVFFCYTLERQKYQDGMQKPYSVPLGTYPIVLVPSYRFEQKTPRPQWYHGKTPHLGDVPDFTGVEIHPANWPSQLEGCLAPGANHYEDYLDPFTQIRGGCVLGSDVSFAQLMSRLQAATDAISITFVEEP